MDIEVPGWTDFVLQSRCPIWISEIKSATEFVVHHWESGDWIEGTPTKECPKKLNFKNYMQSALGMPINVRNQSRTVSST